jgi:ribosomal subunit interface protein
MQISVAGRNMEMTSAIREYAQKKVAKLEEFFHNIQKAEVVLEVRKIDNLEKAQVAEIRAWLAGKKVIQAQEGGRDMYAAIDLAFEEAKRQIQRHKDKHIKEQRRKSAKIKNIAHETGVYPTDL